MQLVSSETEGFTMYSKFTSLLGIEFPARSAEQNKSSNQVHEVPHTAPKKSEQALLL